MKLIRYSRFTLLAFLLLIQPVSADVMDKYRIKPGHGKVNIKYPSWFKQSFMDLRDDVADARKNGKFGIIIMISQKNCNHCEAFLKTTLSDPSIRQRVQKNFDFIGLDVFDTNKITDTDGRSMPVSQYAIRIRARFTPTLLFYDNNGRKIVRIIGFYPPEKFRLVLDYTLGKGYQKQTLSSYILSKTAVVAKTGNTGLTPDPVFVKPPHKLAGIGKPLLVLFEKPGCKDCKRFHEVAFRFPASRPLLKKFRVVQLDINDKTSRVVTPSGQTLSPHSWARKLQLAYLPASVFFDNQGKEVHRIDSESGADRFNGSLMYVLGKHYLQHKQFQHWRRSEARKRSKQKQ